MDNKRHHTTLTKLFACTMLVGLMAIGSANAQTSHVVVHGSVFGGGNEATVSGNTEVLMQDNATVKTDVYGGGAFASTGTNSTNTTIVTIEGGTVGDADYGTDGKGNVFGGALGDANNHPSVNGAVTVNIGTSTQDANNVVIKGNIFGCNNAAGTPKDSVRVHIYHTAHTAANAVGSYATMAAFTAYVNTAAAHDPSAFALQAVYGGGNKADYTPASGKGTRVYIHNCDNTVKMVYGGGRAAAVGTNSVNATTSITVDGGRIDTLFAGGDGHTTSDGLPKHAGNTYLAADINGNVSAWVRCGYYSAVFGASNTSGTINGTKSVIIDKSGPCANAGNDEFIVSLFGGGNMADISGDVDLTIACGAGEFDEVYGGSNMASINAGDVTLNLYGGSFQNVFGGSKGVVGGAAANIGGKVTLNLYGGTMVNAFGGSNQNGNITDSIIVNVLDREISPCELHVTNLYGAGNVTAYKPTDTTITSPVVNLIHINNNGAGVSGDVFGGGLGLTATVTANPQVNIGYDATSQASILSDASYSEPNGFPIAKVGNNVYGGGSLASVVGNTEVNIRHENTVVINTVYGAGKGVYTNPEAAIVKGNATVTMDDGNVHHSIYGGGELSSVGTFTLHASTKADSSATVANGHVKGEPASAKAGTGITKIVINGGLIGLRDGRNRMPDPNNPTSYDDYGYVFCAGKGMADPRLTENIGGEEVPYANRLAVVDSTYLEINGGLITASVYGGSENGEVLRNTHVKITGGQIGVGYEPKTDTWDNAYTPAQWNNVLKKVRKGDFVDGDAAGFHFCDAWPFNAEGTRYTYDYFATHYNSTDKQYYYDASFTKPSYNGSNRAGDGHSYFGHVFGGGSGYYPYDAGLWRRSAGRVLGNTYVEIIGGHILTNIYGGNEITDVLGSTKVEMTGGTLGVPRSTDSILARPVNCNLFGAGMGDPRILFNKWSNVASTEVIVGGNAVIFGSVFGGGEDGHVLGDASTTIKDSAVIGTTGGSGLDGNVYGGGRGFSTWALTAGVVSGNVTLNIQDSARIHGSIYGGGRLAAVGTHLVDTNNADYGEMQSGTTHGNIAINITGGTVGNSYKMGGDTLSIGDVFGGSKGTLGLDVAKNQRLGLAKNTTINISQADNKYPTHILGNVYGGGEIASVGHYNYADATEAAAFVAAHPGESMAEGDVYDTIVPSTAETIGLATITISGGTIGTEAAIGNASQVAAFTHRALGHTLYRKGSVFGGCLGMAAPQYSGYSFVTNSKVTIKGTALVVASVFGGGENGHVFNSTNVRIEGGRVGQELEASEHEEDDNGVGKVEDIYFGNVYGGGRGIDTYRDHGTEYHSVTAGRVGDSANVTMTGGRVTHNIYGGGSLASVGYKDEQASGTATVTVKGGVVGYADAHVTIDSGIYYYDGVAANLTDNTQKAAVQTFYKYAGNNEGNVYGSGRGHAGVDVTDQYVTMAFVKNTVVTLDSAAQMRGSLFGGGENGHVRKDTKVTIAGTAQIGVPLMSAVDWGDAQWHVSPDGYVSWDTLVVSGTKTLSENYYQNESYGSGIHLHEHWIGDNGEGPTIYRGNVYGGGRGVTPTDNTVTTIDAHEYSATAGRVYGNATVEINGGHIYHDVFGGGSLASVGTLVYNITNTAGVKKIFDPMGNEIDTTVHQYVFRQSKTSADSGWHDTSTIVYTRPYYLGDAVTGTGLATITINGGIIGTRGINEGNVFGSGRGIAGINTSSVAHLANANNTAVYVRGANGTDDSNTVSGTKGADIRGAVFGGGANGHVKEDTYVEMTGGTVGVMLPLAVRKIDERTGHGYRNYNGNVYGGGRGVSIVASEAANSVQHLSETAGRVFGNTRVKISGGKVYHSVFGGGSLASVGDYSYKLWNDGDTHRYRHLFVQGTGQAVVHITGDAIIGNAAEALERPLNQYNANDALTAQYLLRTQIDNAEWHDLSAAAAETKWNGLSDDQKQQMFTELNYHYLGSNSGMVFGSGRGVGALHNNTIDKDYANSAFTRNTIVVVDNDGDKIPVICGSVFGGGENGHVKINTHVDINGGIIGGIPLHDTTFYPGRAADNGIDGNSTFKFSNDANLKLSLEYEDDEDNAGHGPAVYRGNVYGGGRGVDHTDALRPEIGYSATAGRVYGDSEVEITGGVIYHHVFGGGSLASVGTYLFYEDGTPYRVDSLYEYKLVAYDDAHTLSAKRDPGKYAIRRAGFRTDGSEPDTMYVLAHADPGNVFVTVKGGQVGVTGINEGSVFGGGRGIAGQSSDMVTLMAYCYRTDVTIDSVAMIRGSVFGGGANGHVLTDAAVTMTGGTVGATLSDAERAINSFGEADIKVYHGNVYGGGRGVDPISSGTGHNLSYTAGRVYGDTRVNITGGTVLHNVYGGGSLATVGTILYRKGDGDPAPGTSLAPTTYDPHGTPQANTGSTSVTIGGTAIIGSDGMNNGSVFGSCRGVAGPGYSDRAYVYNTTVTINAGTDGKPFIHGSVFGSGENGHVQNNTVVTINGGTIGSDLPDGYASLANSEKQKYDYIGNVYGAGRGVDTYKDNENHTHYSFSAGYVRNTTSVTVNGGTILRNVYGGGSMGLVGDYGILGDSTTWQGTGDNGTATVNIYSTIGTAANRAKGYGGNVYGSSRGRANDPADAATIPYFLADGGFGEFAYVYKSHVTIDAPGDTVYGSVYGGGENGHVDYGGTTVDILDGTIKGNIFGGGQGSSTSPTAGIVDGNTQVNIGNSSRGNATIEGNVFGGNDAGSSPLGNMRVDVYSTAHTSANTCPTIVPPATEPDTTGSNIATNYAIFGVYGGGNQASVLTGNGSLDCSGTIYDTLYQGRITGSWPVDTYRKSIVYVHGCENTIMYVYGGGRAANTLNNTVTIEGGRFYQVYAGGNGSSVEVPGNPGANVSALTGTIAPPNSGDATVTILGGLAGQLFGGSNSKGVVEGTATVDIAPDGNCPILTKEVFGGGNEAPGGSAVVTVPCGATGLTDVYGGARNADIGTPTDRKNIVLTIEGGDMTRVFGGNMSGGRIYGDVTVNVYGSNPGHTIDEVFGGSNEGGNIFGNIIVNVDSTHNSTCCGGCPLKLNNVYGGGNLVAYIPDSTWKDGTDHANPKDTVWSDPTRISPVVNVINGTVRQNVFGGGKGYQNLRPVLKPRTQAEWTSAGHAEYFTSQAAYDDSLATYNAYLDKVNAARVMGNPVVTIGAIDREVTTGVNPNARVGYVDGSGNVYPGNVYGGGNAAPVDGNTKVVIQGNRTDIMGSVYGGGNAAKVTGNTTVEIGDHN